MQQTHIEQQTQKAKSEWYTVQKQQNQKKTISLDKANESLQVRCIRHSVTGLFIIFI